MKTTGVRFTAASSEYDDDRYRYAGDPFSIGQAQVRARQSNDLMFMADTGQSRAAPRAVRASGGAAKRTRLRLERHRRST
ncbi:hypothetical protein AQJ23_40000 [Streptomyces antibioticus]|nr:hypothetical protein AQJ23_40000 [Streptomyces antibioticus]